MWGLVSLVSLNNRKDLTFIEQLLHSKHNDKYLYMVFNPSNNPMGGGTLITIILQIKNLKLNEAKKLAQSQSQGFK